MVIKPWTMTIYQCLDMGKAWVLLIGIPPKRYGKLRFWKHDVGVRFYQTFFFNNQSSCWKANPWLDQIDFKWDVHLKSFLSLPGWLVTVTIWMILPPRISLISVVISQVNVGLPHWMGTAMGAYLPASPAGLTCWKWLT